MIAQDGIEIVDVPIGQRQGLERILDDSFEGWYLRAARGTLQDIEVVRVAMSDGRPIGLVMLKTLEQNVGYVYYIAVAKTHRRTGVAKLLLEDALQRFVAAGMKEVYASVEEDNEPSEKLFASEGFTPTSFGEVSKNHGSLRTINMYRIMRVVPGEVLLRKALT
ncbi:MAG: GNAT family N-acetyltransferase [Thaumarchaeota archaeon]|nr:GNAT family N-acetyltransferase [Nitrososphaerota archaeon]